MSMMLRMAGTLNKPMFNPPFALGGDDVYEIEVDGLWYRVHEFTTVGESELTVVRGGKIDRALHVAGGGHGGAGGGGAGGMLETEDIEVAVGVHPVFVGAGGSENNIENGNGQDTTGLGLTAFGGAWGNRGVNDNGLPGGSGSGAAWRNTTSGTGTGGAGTAGQGHKGGDVVFGGGGTGVTGGAGGGGAGGVGQGAGVLGVDRTQASGGDGGPGKVSDIRGVPEHFAGGGGGGTHLSDGDEYVRGIGGVGGGGSGERRSGTLDATPGSPNTGGGGGGRATVTVNGPKPGGSGIVIIRYRIGGPTL